MTEYFHEFFNIYLVGLGVMAMQRDNGLPSNEGIRFEEVECLPIGVQEK